MKAFFDIISFSTGCLFWGILIGIICMVLFFLLIKGWYKHAEASPATYLVGGILFVYTMHDDSRRHQNYQYNRLL